MVNLKEIMADIEKFAMEKMVPDILHGWSHIERILKYASIVNKEMNGDWEVIQCAISLHDIGHKINREKHNVISAKLAEEFLLSKAIDTKIVTNIKNSILTHSRQFSDQNPDSVEAKVIYDADGMDLFGPIGLMRALLSCTLRNKEFECIIKKLEWRLEQIPNFFSDVAKKFVLENSEIIKMYLNELKKQIDLVKRL